MLSCICQVHEQLMTLSSKTYRSMLELRLQIVDLQTNKQK